ncbi:MAG TPA: hypothetical protein P5234_05245 [Thermoanaerobaculaceae bacterium]|nr:hypothetical protein [Thermoanaerobaculaceae bacterium]HRS15640.1 hypothetical protein [Thermoanaerobaculaceae bacterium]
MKMNRLVLMALCSVVIGMLVGCSGGNDSADTEANILLSVDIPEGVADVPVNLGADVAIPNFTIKSQPKTPGIALSQQSDAILNEWVVTFTRTDGGTVASRMWRNFYTVYVPAGGSASLTNYRVMPVEYLSEPPLNQLWPENGGFDKETGKDNIRQKLRVDIYGKTVAGQRVSVGFDINVRFYYALPE